MHFFGRLWQHRLLYKTQRLLIPQLFQLVKSFLTERIATYLLMDKSRPPNQSLPEFPKVASSVLLYILSMQICLRKLQTEVYKQEVIIVAYSDDTCVLTKSTNILAVTFAFHKYLNAYHQRTMN